MSQVIWKWEIPVTDLHTVFLPKGAEILSVQIQHHSCCLWARCDPLAKPTPRKIAIYGTGNPIPDPNGVYISTFQMANGNLVFHAFELPPTESKNVQ